MGAPGRPAPNNTQFPPAAGGNRKNPGGRMETIDYEAKINNL